jgi:hypothetical protein
MTYDTHSRSTAVLALVLAGCVPCCSGSSQQKSSLARPVASVGSAMPPEPALERGSWHAPLPVPQGEGKLAWAGTSAPSPCRAAVNTGPVIRVDNEADFEALFCRSSDVDWRRFQLFWYRLAATAERALATEDVVLNDSQINWLLVPESCPDWNGPSAPAPAILIARSDLPVVARPKPAVPADCPAGDGYGY